MTRKAFWLIPLSLLVATSIPAVDAGQSMTMKVTPHQALAPVNLRVSVRIEPHADNRGLMIVADGADFYRSSQITLEGERAPRVVNVEYPNVPGGNYDVTGVLLNSLGEERATVHQVAIVVPIGGEPE